MNGRCKSLPAALAALCMATVCGATEKGEWFKRSNSSNAESVQLSEWFSGSCDDLRNVLQKQILAENFREVDVRNPNMTRWHLGMALRWALKENTMLQTMLTQTLAELASAKTKLTQTLEELAGAKSRQHDTFVYPATEVQPLSVAEVSARTSVISVDTLCDSEMVLIPPGVDAHFEQDAEGNPVPRLDGVSIAGLNISEKVKVYLCKETELGGRFIVHKAIGCSDRDFSSDGLYRRMAHRLCGPDEFQFVLEGPELIDLRSALQYHGSCTYVFPFNVTIDGTYHLHLVLQRENWAGADETDPRWPVAHCDQPLGNHVFLSFGQLNRTHSALQAAQSGDWLHRCQLKPPLHGAVDSSWYAYMRGRWVSTRIHPADVAEMFLPVKNPELKGGCWRAPPVVPLEAYQWQPYQCKQRYFAAQEARECIRDQHLVFRGDSHMRVLFNALMQLACGAEQQGTWTNDYCHDDARHGQGLCPGPAWKNLCVVNDTVGEAGPGCVVDKGGCGRGVTIANFGHHPASGFHHWTNAKYRKRVDEYVQQLKQAPAERLRSEFMWMQSNHMMLRKDPFIMTFEDWRTLSRLAIMNDYADTRMQELGVSILPAFVQTGAIRHMDPDISHINLVSLRDSAVQHLLNFLCPDDAAPELAQHRSRLQAWRQRNRHSASANPTTQEL